MLSLYLTEIYRLLFEELAPEAVLQYERDHMYTLFLQRIFSRSKLPPIRSNAKISLLHAIHIVNTSERKPIYTKPCTTRMSIKNAPRALERRGVGRTVISPKRKKPHTYHVGTLTSNHYLCRISSAHRRIAPLILHTLHQRRYPPPRKISDAYATDLVSVALDLRIRRDYNSPR